MAVAERQGSLTLALEGSRSRKEEALSSQVFEKQGLLEQAGLMVYTQELLKETDAPCFVQAARITHNRLEIQPFSFSSICYLYLNFLKFILLSYFSRLVKAIENLQCFCLAAEPSFRHFHLDASKEIKIINNLDFIQCGLSASLFLQYMVC